VAAVNAVVALYYYARVVKTVWMDPVPEQTAGDRTSATARSLVLVLGIAAVVILVVGVFPGISAFFGDATRILVAG